MQMGLAAYEATGGKLWSPYFLGQLADALAKAGRIEEGFAAIEKAIMLAEQTGERYSLAELYRIKGELILKTVDWPAGRLPGDRGSKASEIYPPRVQAKACLAEALAIAQEQQAKFWQVRANNSM